METSPIPVEYHKRVTSNISRGVEWTEPGLKILRLRLLSDPGHPYWDISYCHGELPSGEFVNVYMPFPYLKKKPSINAQIIAWAKKENFFAKKTGIFDAISTLC